MNNKISWTPWNETLLYYIYDIILNYQTAPNFNKLELFKIMWNKYNILNKYFFLYYNFPTYIKYFIDKTYKPFSIIFLAEWIDKIKNLIKFFKYYFKRESYLKEWIAKIYFDTFVMILSVFISIFWILLTDMYFYTNGKNLIP